MPIFNDKVALEASPAKTAESVSYGVAFSVLGWLLVSNYAVLGSGEDSIQDLAASTPTDASIALELSEAIPLGPNREAADSAAEIRNGLAEQPILVYASVVESESRDLLTAAPLPLELQASQNATVKRTFDLSDWKSLNLAGESMLQIEEIALPRPSLALDYIIRDQAVGAAADLASVLITGSEPIREITVNSDATDTLSSSRVQIPRPQIPRSYRAQDIQRSLVLPPRIQALKP